MMDPRIEALRARIDAETNARHVALYPTLAPEPVTIKIRRKYVLIDVGMSGRYLIDGDRIFGIKSYGVPHRGHQFGTLDTIDEWNWSGYRAVRRPNR